MFSTKKVSALVGVMMRHVSLAFYCQRKTGVFSIQQFTIPALHKTTEMFSVQRTFFLHTHFITLCEKTEAAHFFPPIHMHIVE
jgi:hypothetical protein